MIRACWWGCGKDILPHYERRLSTSSARRQRYKRNFLGRRGREYSRAAAAHNLYRTVGDLNVYVKYELLEVKVLVIFFATEGFSLCRDGY